MTERLTLASLARLDPSMRPSIDPRSVSVGVVHLGLGAFHRAHQAVYTEAAMANTGDTGWGICGVTQRSRSVVDALAPQDCLYSVLERQDGSSRVSVVGAVRQVLFAREDSDELLVRLSQPTTRVVTLTVTEKGYRHDPATGRLRRDDPEVAADAAGRVPATVVGQLGRGLQRRYRTGGAPLAVVSCDNLPGNGRLLGRLVEDFLTMLPAEDTRGLAEWVAGNVTFPCTMVDRIVPASTDQDRADAAGMLGLDDHAVVVAEPFSQWVIEDRFPAARPAWEEGGAVLTGDVEPYEAMKLRLLNGSHSALAYLGSLAGHEFISDAIRAEGYEAYVHALMDKDVTPTLQVPFGFDLDAYKTDLRTRFANQALRHSTVQVAMDGTQKLPQRLLPVIRQRLAAGDEPRLACLAVAGWMRFVAAGRSDDGRPLPLDDPLAQLLRDRVGEAGSARAVADALLGVEEVFGPDLGRDPAFRSLVTEALADVTRHGAAETVRAATR
ncbi:mannitol dehydrogenase family protein [Acidiferrimicrobium sp. IK]|uniref:mannitol dehydrogenase family protein n=1 Tax=Acidiferrimicrobium sp. IK TaxID=2871700 RepID=UPI0021CB1630|nr:mannitol dehydrogenase family protein [Acidiferrimicrobium sp. IK]MCU4186883.1 mannitol dehydrogenase family protein [Acidiferrimicrobium sp. IK]